jgi:hypothetical protein
MLLPRKVVANEKEVKNKKFLPKWLDSGMCEHVDLEIRFVFERFWTFRTINFREYSGSGQESLRHDVAAPLRRRLLARVRVGQ